ncbi:TPA: TIGR00645 family protein [Burkholderia cepacia]|uniref:TIGR00645 family protein n=1 Tax=Burkholderia cepacia TaxID=292 RepID=UPI001CF1E437|nr:TIGR00645 family protein [Burkholderia cepacia]MCA8363953.1 TIGR00645 family protein [Burkholderia cepacia]HDR9763090.1 TIGR00645 family protein [Burkholderia cepacia ATCC 25416]HDV6371334.1 TIGR00645 family protein [Burkholderia cepacia]
MSAPHSPGRPARRPLRPLPALIFMSRWLQVPLYLGLIVAQAVYVFLFLKEVWHLLSHATSLDEISVMLAVLGLIDVVMISNLLIMVIVGGYETFVSRLGIEGHPDEPEWLDHVNAGVLKVKLSMALISISSIHLLKTFINPDQHTTHAIMWQVIIHVSFLVSALVMAWVDRLTTHTHPAHFHETHAHDGHAPAANEPRKPAEAAANA